MIAPTRRTTVPFESITLHVRFVFRTPRHARPRRERDWVTVAGGRTAAQRHLDTALYRVDRRAARRRRRG